MTGFDPTAVAATEAELVDLVRALSDHADRRLAVGTRSLTPMLLVKSRGWGGKPDELRLHVLDVPFNEHADKRAILQDLGRKLYADQVVPAGAAMCTEAWLAADLAPGQKPADSPNRREAVVVFAASIGGRRAVLRSRFVYRDSADRMVPDMWDVVRDGASSPLLNHLWRGYFEVVFRKHAERN